jgi:Protein of unknown function (DUF1573)
MKRKLKLLDYTLVAIFLFALFIFAFPRIRNYIVHRKTVNNPDITKLAYNPSSSLDFGVIKKGEKKSFQITIYNTGLSKLHIRDIHLSCGCTKVVLAKYDIGLKDSTVLNGVIDTKDKSGASMSKIFFSANTKEKHEVIFLNYEVQ